MKVDTLIVGGTLVTHDATFKGNITVKGEQIAEIGGPDYRPDASKIIDATGKYVIPGMIDAHAHVGWPDWPIDQAYAQDTIGAAFGGVTTVIDRVTLPPGSLVEQIFGENGRKRVAEENAYVDVALQVALFTPEQVEEVPALAELGILGFKFYIPYRGTEAVAPMVGIDDGLIYKGFKKIGEYGRGTFAQIHAENIEIFFAIKADLQKEGKDCTWADARPNFMETEPIIRCAHFGKVTNCPVYVVHMSTGEGPELVAKLRTEGCEIIVETCPQYLTLTDRSVDRILSKVNPPIRRTTDNEGLWRGINRGLVTNFGSDHAPCATKHKTEFWTAIVGFSGIETMLPVMLSEGVNKGKITLNKLVEIGTANNAKLFGLWPKKGCLAVGSDADIVIVDMGLTKTVRAEELHSLSDFTPYEGRSITGWPVLTMVRGKVITEGDSLLGSAGYGTYLPGRLAQ